MQRQLWESPLFKRGEDVKNGRANSEQCQARRLARQDGSNHRAALVRYMRQLPDLDGRDHQERSLALYRVRGDAAGGVEVIT